MMTPPVAAGDTPGPLQAVIVDLDGTLVDTLGDFEAALTAMLHEFSLPPAPRAFIERTVGKGSEHLVARTLAWAGAPDDVQGHAFALYQQHYAQVNGRHSVVYPGAVEGLQRLAARGLKMACVTNKPARFARALLQQKTLDRYFGVVFGGDDFERKKPDPMPLLRTCEVLGVPPARTLMVGDSVNDAQAARAAGCPVALVTYGYNHGEPVAPGLADVLVDRLDALPL